MSEKIIHFGEFVRWHRTQAGKTTEAFGREIGLSSRRVISIEAMAKPDVQHTTIVALARVLGIEPAEFDRVWRSTPVPVTKRRKGPSNDEATRFSVACSANGVTPVEGMRRLRSWITMQNEETQMRVLGQQESAGSKRLAAGSNQKSSRGKE